MLCSTSDRGFSWAYTTSLRACSSFNQPTPSSIIATCVNTVTNKWFASFKALSWWWVPAFEAVNSSLASMGALKCIWQCPKKQCACERRWRRFWQWMDLRILSLKFAIAVAVGDGNSTDYISRADKPTVLSNRAHDSLNGILWTISWLLWRAYGSATVCLRSTLHYYKAWYAFASPLEQQ